MKFGKFLIFQHFSEEARWLLTTIWLIIIMIAIIRFHINVLKSLFVAAGAFLGKFNGNFENLSFSQHFGGEAAELKTTV